MDHLLAACSQQLRSLPFVNDVRLHDGRDGPSLIEILTPTTPALLRAEIHRSHLSREVARTIAHQAQGDEKVLVLAPSIGRPVGDLFEAAGVNFVDGIGNCYVRIGERYVARVQGRKREKRVEHHRGLRAPAYRVLFALLARPRLLSDTARSIATEADVSPQTANAFRRRLVEQGLVLEVRGRRRMWAPNRHSEALAMWVSGFSSTLAPSLLIGRYRHREHNVGSFERRIEPILDDACQWGYGGGAAADRLTQHFRGESTTLYVASPPSDLAQRLVLVRDPSGPVTLHHSPGTAAFEAPVPRCVHPLLVYADLVTQGNERADEAAQIIRTDFIELREPAGTQ